MDLRTFHDLDLDLVGLVLGLRLLALDLLVLEGLGALVDLLGRGTFPDELEVDGLEMSLVGVEVVLGRSLDLLVTGCLDVGEAVGLELFVGLAVEEMVRRNGALDGLVADEIVRLDVEEAVRLVVGEAVGRVVDEAVGLAFEELGQLAVLVDALMGLSAGEASLELMAAVVAIDSVNLALHTSRFLVPLLRFVLFLVPSLRFVLRWLCNRSAWICFAA